ATFALVYLVSGLAGSAASAVLDPRTFMPMVGSSGAVAGVMGLCLLGAPRASVRIWFHAGVAAGAIRVRAAWLFSAWMVLQAVGAFYLSLGNATDVGYWAHLGGVATGLAAGFFLRKAGRFEGHEQEREEAKKEEAKPESAEAAAGPAGAGRATVRPAVLRRIRERPAAPYLPGVLIALSIVVSLIAVALRFSHGTLMGTLADFQGAWNSGDIERVARLFPDESRDQFTQRLQGILSRLDPEAPEGAVTYRIALLRARREGDRCTALYASAPPGADPFRTERTGVIGVTFLRDAGGWTVHALGVKAIRPCEADGP
ncbi:MAG: rhomboid family intramembrane serine protease, partial [Planctomycetota bacterium]